MWQGGPPRSYYDGLADMNDYGTISTLKRLAAWFNRNGTPSEGVFPKDLPPYMKEVSVLNDSVFYGAFTGDMIIISDKEPNKYLYFEDDGYGAGYADVRTANFTDKDYKPW